MAAILERRVIELVYEDGLTWPDSDNEYITNTTKRVVTVMFIEVNPLPSCTLIAPPPSRPA